MEPASKVTQFPFRPRRAGSKAEDAPVTGRRCSAPPPARPHDELSVTKITFFFTNSHSASAAGDAPRTAGRACPDPLTPAGRALPVLSNTRQQCCCKNHATSKPTASAPVAQPARTVLSVGSGARRKAVRHVYHKRRHRRPDEHRGTARGCANDGTTQIATSAADTALPVLEDCQTSCRNVRKSLAGGCLSKNQGQPGHAAAGSLRLRQKAIRLPQRRAAYGGPPGQRLVWPRRLAAFALAASAWSRLPPGPAMLENASGGSRKAERHPVRQPGCLLPPANSLVRYDARTAGSSGLTRRDSWRLP